jgi:hypothetical protein
MDANTGRSTDHGDPQGCAGGLVAVGSGELLYRCADQPRTRYVVVDIATSREHPVVGTDHLPYEFTGAEGFSTELVAIGSQWAEGRTSGATHLEGSIVYLNWHTGQLRQEGKEPPLGYRRTADLNYARLFRPICPPLTHKLVNEIHIPSWEFPFAYMFPFVVETPGWKGQLRLRKCGSNVAHELSGERASSLQVGAGIVSWIAADPHIANNDDTMYSTRLNGHVPSWHGRIEKLWGPEVGASWMLLQHTSTMVYETAERLGPLRIYAMRIP